jgi:hypothetical protein
LSTKSLLAFMLSVGLLLFLSFEVSSDPSNTTPSNTPLATVNIDTANITAGDTFVLTTGWPDAHDRCRRHH